MDKVVKLKVDMIDGFTVIELINDRLDASVSPNFKFQIDELISKGDQRIVLNLANVEFMDSSGLGTIVACYKKMQGLGEMLFCEMQPSVKTIFELTHMDRIFLIFDTLEDCLNKKSA